MTAYLKIENPGVCPSEFFTILGAGSKAKVTSSRTIGKFGTGSKHAVAVCLRHGLTPIVFCSNLRLDFFTREQHVNDGISNHRLERVCVKYGGKAQDGTHRSSTEDLGFVLDHGITDWLGMDLACREFVSNAIDRAMEQAEYEFIIKWSVEHGVTEENKQDPVIVMQLNVDLVIYRQNSSDYRNVTVEVVNANQVRAKGGTTRVFIPMDEKVFEFYHNLGKWFLHFSEPHNLHKVILPKNNRNSNGRLAAVIYRRGVRVREFESSEVPSLFDYNLPDLELDECRKVDDWRVKVYAGAAFVDAEKGIIKQILQSFLDGSKRWEHEFDAYGLETYARGDVEKRKKVWQDAFSEIAAHSIINKGDSQIAKAKGYGVVQVPEVYVEVAGRLGLPTLQSVFSTDDREGRVIIDPHPDALAAVNWVWDNATRFGMTNGKDKPKVYSFTQIMEAGGQLLGFYRSGTVYINTDITGGGLNQQLLATALEETSHYVTNAIDFSRDLQDWILNFAVKANL